MCAVVEAQASLVVVAHAAATFEGLCLHMISTAALQYSCIPHDGFGFKAIGFAFVLCVV